VVGPKVAVGCEASQAAVGLEAMVVGTAAVGTQAETAASLEVEMAECLEVVEMEEALLAGRVEAGKAALPAKAAAVMAAACREGKLQLLCIVRLSIGSSMVRCRQSTACTQHYTALRYAFASSIVAAILLGC
jgi:hypothetical protein